MNINISMLFKLTASHIKPFPQIQWQFVCGIGIVAPIRNGKTSML